MTTRREQRRPLLQRRLRRPLRRPPVSSLSRIAAVLPFLLLVMLMMRMPAFGQTQPKAAAARQGRPATSISGTKKSAPRQQREARRQLKVVYLRLSRAMSQQGVAAPRQLKRVLQDVLAPGPLREQMLAGVEHSIAAGGDPDQKKMLAFRFRLQKLTMKDDRTAIAMAEQTADVIRRDSEGEYGPVGKVHRIQGAILFRDTWTRIGKKWKLTDSQDVETKLVVDGKPWKPKQQQEPSSAAGGGDAPGL